MQESDFKYEDYEPSTYQSTVTTVSSDWYSNNNYRITHVRFSRQQKRAMQRILDDKSLTEQDKEVKINKIRKQNEIKS